MEYRIDDLDRKILAELMRDSRTPYLEIARRCDVSGGTIHQRVGKLREAGIIRGSRVTIDYERLGYTIVTFIGVRVTKAGDHKVVQRKLASFPEVVEVHYTTGAYSLFIKAVVREMHALHRLLSEKLQGIPEIQSTETFVVLNTSTMRDRAID